MNNPAATRPLVSVVLCTYNGEAFLAEQIQSLLAQTYSPFEIIVSDDASTDGTRSLLQPYEANPQFRIFYQEKNIGYIQNFAFALSHARGNYIALCDQDDVWLPHKIETLLQCMGNAWLTYSDSLLTDEKGASLRKKLSDIRNMEGGKDTRSFFLFNVAWGHAMLFDRRLLDAALPIPDDTPHDVWFAYKAATITGINYCNEVLTHYRQHRSAYTQTLMPKNVPTRSHSKRFQGFLKQLHWLQILKDHAQPAEHQFYNEFHRLFKEKENGKFSYALFSFLLKNQKALYRFSKKNFISKLIDIRKLARGEKP